MLYSRIHLWEQRCYFDSVTRKTFCLCDERTGVMCCIFDICVLLVGYKLSELIYSIILTGFSIGQRMVKADWRWHFSEFSSWSSWHRRTFVFGHHCTRQYFQNSSVTIGSIHYIPSLITHSLLTSFPYLFSRNHPSANSQIPPIHRPPNVEPPPHTSRNPSTNNVPLPPNQTPLRPHPQNPHPAGRAQPPRPPPPPRSPR